MASAQENCLVFAILRESTKRQSSATLSSKDDFLLASDRKNTNAIFSVHLILKNTGLKVIAVQQKLWLTSRKISRLST
jgi:hypothetical protein